MREINIDLLPRRSSAALMKHQSALTARHPKQMEKIKINFKKKKSTLSQPPGAAASISGSATKLLCCMTPGSMHRTTSISQPGDVFTHLNIPPRVTGVFLYSSQAVTGYLWAQAALSRQQVQSFNTGKAQLRLFSSSPAASQHPRDIPATGFSSHYTSPSSGPKGFAPRLGNPVPIQGMRFPSGRMGIYAHP